MGTLAETAIIYYRWSFANQGKKPQFSVSVCSKQTEVCRFRFPFAAKSKWEFLFSASSVFRMCVYWGLGSVCVCVYNIFKFIFMYMYSILPFRTKNGKRSLGNFPQSVYRLLIVQLELCLLSICWWNKRKLPVCKQTKRTCPSMLLHSIFPS